MCIRDRYCVTTATANNTHMESGNTEMIKYVVTINTYGILYLGFILYIWNVEHLRFSMTRTNGTDKKITARINVKNKAFSNFSS